MAPALRSCPAPRSPLAHTARQTQIARQPRRYERLRVCAVAEFVGKTAGTRNEALLIHKFTAHTSSLAAALVLRDTGEGGAQGSQGFYTQRRSPTRPANCWPLACQQNAGAGLPCVDQGSFCRRATLC